MTPSGEERIVQALEQIASRLLDLRDLLADLAAPRALPDCPHPPDRRISLGGMGGREHWRCQDCKFEFRAPRADGPVNT